MVSSIPQKTVLAKLEPDLTSQCVNITNVNGAKSSISVTKEPLSISSQIPQAIPVSNFSGDLANFNFNDVIQTCPLPFDLGESEIKTSRNRIDADAISTSTITVQLKDYQGVNIGNGGETVVISTSSGTLSTTTDNGNGTYTATLTSATTPGTATLSFTVNGQSASDTTNVVFEAVIAQSPHLYLQAAGSTGADGSVAGIHLRWLFKNDLRKHLPKGDLASSTANYNKPNDLVRLFRAYYVEAPEVIDLTQPPKAIERQRALWLYEVNGATLVLHFKDRDRYRSARSAHNPKSEPVAFLEAYGDGLLELESRGALFFGIRFKTVNQASPSVRTEILSVEGNTPAAPRAITARKTFSGSAALSNPRLQVENGRVFRCQATNCRITEISIDFYHIAYDIGTPGVGWTLLGEFSLATDDTTVFTRLEPTPNSVNGQWPRYNDGALVKVQNYKDKWKVTNPVTQSSILQTVEDYIALSDAEDNPSAIESFNFEDALPEGVDPSEDTSFELANLVLLQQASFDFHVARMLGLGHLDLDNEAKSGQQVMYMITYETKVTEKEGVLVSEETEHRYITLPTSINDQRLPIPVNLKTPQPGLVPNNGLGVNEVALTDADGYTHDGKTRFISLFVAEPEDLTEDLGFYHVSTEFNLSEATEAVFAGIEFKTAGATQWIRPELPNTDQYQNLAPSGQTPYNETIHLPLPEAGIPLYVHRQRESGTHVYSSYGVNWFSRSTPSTVEHQLQTTIKPKDKLAPPHNRNAFLVVEEAPLVLTSAKEQQMLANITGDDKTLIRLTFDYHTRQDLLSYKVTPENMAGASDPLAPDAIFPDDQEVFGKAVELFYRDALPLNVTGRVVQIEDHPTNPVLSVISTGSYTLDSTGETLSPNLPAGQFSNFVGGVFVLEDQEFIIHKVEAGPKFTVFKKQLSDRLMAQGNPVNEDDLASPEVNGEGLFLAVENLLNTSSWGSPNPHPLKVQIGDNWPVHRELIKTQGADTGVEEWVEKSRGYWDTASITKELEVIGLDDNGNPIKEHRGKYKIRFSELQLPNHPQAGQDDPVQWYKGMVRVHTSKDSEGRRRALEVIYTQHIGTQNKLVLYAEDTSFSSEDTYDPILTGAVTVNYYPGYRIYLYANTSAGLTENTVLPLEGAGIKYGCFGLRTVTSEAYYASRIAPPTVFYAQEVIEPLIPEKPLGVLFATRPDRFGKATYTLTTTFKHKPHGLQYYRSEDDALLNTLYKAATVKTIKEALKNTDPQFLGNRWQNVLGFDYVYPNGSYQTNGLFAIYPEDEEGYRFPNPDHPSLFQNGGSPGQVPPGAMADRIKEAIFQVFVPLTEIPLIYEHITTDADAIPANRPQVVRDRNGALLVPGADGFEMAPMAKITGTNTVQFTDFGLDGTSNNVYFYAVREISNKLVFSDFSPVLGPIQLVNTLPPVAPGIQQVVPVLENTALGIIPRMIIRVNAYPQVAGITRLALYRAIDATAALSLRSMAKVQELDLAATDQLEGNRWEIGDTFADLSEIPFGDPLFYRVVVLREVTYADSENPETIITEYVPSQPSKLLVSALVESTAPQAPTIAAETGSINANQEVNQVVLRWNKTAYNGKYFLYKLNDQGQWGKIYEIASNEAEIVVPLAETEWGSDTLPIADPANDNANRYHHFKVVVENTAGLMSSEAPLITIPKPDNS
ncbi:MAG: Ig-like domain-containing protein [Bacteroidota bacterium]